MLNLQDGCAAVITFEGRPPWQTEPMTWTEWASALNRLSASRSGRAGRRRHCPVGSVFRPVQGPPLAPDHNIDLSGRSGSTE